MSRFAGIAAAMERGARESIGEEIKDFQLKLYKSTWQALAEKIASIIPKSCSIIRTRHEKNERILRTIRAYRPLIEEQYGLYHHFFYEWEYDNCEGGYHRQAEDSRGESKALSEIRRLTDEMQAELDMAGWAYNPIPHACTLVTGYPGHTYIDKALKYFELLEKHFDKRR